MKPVELSNGRVVLRTRMSVFLTSCDLVAVVCFGLAKRRVMVNSRKGIGRLTQQLLEAKGAEGVNIAGKKYSAFTTQAICILVRHFPELFPRDYLLEPSNN